MQICTRCKHHKKHVPILGRVHRCHRDGIWYINPVTGKKHTAPVNCKDYRAANLQCVYYEEKNEDA